MRINGPSSFRYIDSRADVDFPTTVPPASPRNARARDAVRTPLRDNPPPQSYPYDPEFLSRAPYVTGAKSIIISSPSSSSRMRIAHTLTHVSRTRHPRPSDSPTDLCTVYNALPELISFRTRIPTILFPPTGTL